MFGQKLELHKTQGDTLKEKASIMRKVKMGLNLKFTTVFNRILEVVVDRRLSEHKLEKRVFVFSDVGFDLVIAKMWETDHIKIKRKFKEVQSLCTGILRSQIRPRRF